MQGSKLGELIKLPTFFDPRGNLSFANGNEHIPFTIERMYFLHGVPRGSERGAHAHRKLTQFMIAAAGSFEVHLDNGNQQKTITLDDPGVGLLIHPMTWRVLGNFSEGSICLVLASMAYREDDYLRSYRDFQDALE